MKIESITDTTRINYQGAMMKSKKMYHYKCELVRVIDGDTQEFKVSLGFEVYMLITVRVLDLNTPEIRGKEKILGLVYKQAAIEVIQESEEIILQTKSRGKYGRWLANIFLDDKDFKGLLEKRVKRLLK